MSKYQKRAATFSFLCALSLMFGQVTKTSFTYAPLISFFTGYLFSILAAINAYKAYVRR